MKATRTLCLLRDAADQELGEVLLEAKKIITAPLRRILERQEAARSAFSQVHAASWQPSGSLLPPGSRTCLSNRKCELTYR